MKLLWAKVKIKFHLTFFSGSFSDLIELCSWYFLTLKSEQFNYIETKYLNEGQNGPLPSFDARKNLTNWLA